MTLPDVSMQEVVDTEGNKAILKNYTHMLQGSILAPASDDEQQQPPPLVKAAVALARPTPGTCPAPARLRLGRTAALPGVTSARLRPLARSRCAQPARHSPPAVTPQVACQVCDVQQHERDVPKVELTASNVFRLAAKVVPANALSPEAPALPLTAAHMAITETFVRALRPTAGRLAATASSSVTAVLRREIWQVASMMRGEATISSSTSALNYTEALEVLGPSFDASLEAAAAGAVAARKRMADAAMARQQRAIQAHHAAAAESRKLQEAALAAALAAANVSAAAAAAAAAAPPATA